MKKKPLILLRSEAFLFHDGACIALCSTQLKLYTADLSIAETRTI